MTHIKYIIVLLALLMPFQVSAQDSRNREVSTIIADGLAQLPAQNLEALEQVMSEIAGTGAEGIQQLAAMLGPSAEGKNAPFEYAIDGLTSYVTVKGREAQCAAVRKGLEAAIAKCKDEGNAAFLRYQLSKLTPGSQEVQLAPEDLTTIAPASRAVVEFCDKAATLPVKKKASLLLKTLQKSNDRQLRVTALGLEDAAVIAPLVCKAFPKLKADAQADVGNNEIATAAIEAAGKIGGNDAMGVLINALDGNHSAAAHDALAAFNGHIGDGILAALKAKGAAASPALVALAGERHLTAAYEPLTALLGNDQLHAAAAKSLAAIVGESQFGDLLSRFRPYPDLFYGLLAQRANKDDLQQIVGAAATHVEARNALLKVATSDAVAPLMSLAAAEKSPRNADVLLGRALTLIKGANWPSLQKYQLLKQALEMKPGITVTNNILSALGTLNNEPALNLAASFMDKKQNELAAAYAVTDLIDKNKPFQRGAHVRDMLLAARDVFKAHAANAGASYAVDQVNTILPKIVDDPNAATEKITKLSAEEEKEGFELLFDGTNLDNWQGNKTDYVPIDGNIYVSAHYGAEGNLYTTKKYSDFVFRFEFFFVRPGINNGVGIRTREGVDAAYEGMEIQILDHDDPIYKGLRDYQQHGSVYGIIVPEHVTFGPLGTWNTEEIRAVGDHITVTVNGKVILDGDIRKACQGHNMAPEEGKPNPYTVDHKSHPGLFNKDGLICFCGHGEGLKLRNIRVLDLSNQKKGKTKARRK